MQAIALFLFKKSIQYLLKTTSNLERSIVYQPKRKKRLSMKSFVTYPLELKPLTTLPLTKNEKIVAHTELFTRIKYLNGTIIKCGVETEIDLHSFDTFRQFAGFSSEQKMIAFQKVQQIFEEEINELGSITLKVNASPLPAEHANAKLEKCALAKSIDYVPGSVCETIPQYLIDNPETKISLLNINLDDYESTMTALEFFYPRLLPGGILIIDNYYKLLSEHRAVNEYFYPRKIEINNLWQNAGAHYIIKP